MLDNPVKLASSGPGGNLKLCPPETAQRIRKEKSGEVLCLEHKDLGERHTGENSKLQWFFLRANFFDRF